MARLARKVRLSWEEILEAAAQELEASAGIEQARDESPLWEPLDLQEGRPGLAWPDGRVLSPQQAAYESPADEVYFGGSVGGGKSDLLLGLALTRHKNSIIFRREFSQLRGAEGLWDRSRQIIGLRGRANESLYLWRDLPGGRSLEFGAVQHEKDVEKWAGRPHDLKAFDELPSFPERVYRFLITWLRTSAEGQRVRVVSAGNPPLTLEGRWVVQYWAPWLERTHPKPARPGELRWYVSDADGMKDVEVEGPPLAAVLRGVRPQAVDVPGRPEPVMPRSRTFIPSSVEDNPYYMRTGYTTVLDNLPEPMRSAMRGGDFSVALSDDAWQVMPTAWVVAAQARWTDAGGDGRPVTAAGCDPSRGGTAEFVIAQRHDAWVAPLMVHPAKAAPEGQAGAKLVHHALRGDTSVPVQIDIIGSAGSSVYDQARDLHLNAVAVDGSARSEGRDKSGKLGFCNLRAELHWRLREMLDPAGGQEIALPPDAQLRADLCAPRWKPTPRGIQIESKDEIVKRLGRSPDRGEAVIYCCVELLPPVPKRKGKAGMLW